MQQQAQPWTFLQNVATFRGILDLGIVCKSSSCSLLIATDMENI